MKFAELSKGNIFLLDNVIYIKIQEIFINGHGDYTLYNAVKLESGQAVSLSDNDNIIPAINPKINLEVPK